MRRTIQLAVACVAVLVATAGQVQGGTIPDRTALQTLLGGPGTLEDFESYNFIDEDFAFVLGSSALDSTSVLNGQGPGLVIPGVTFSTVDNEGLVWRGAKYLGSSSRDIFAVGVDPLVIDFATPTQAFGIDLRALFGYPATATVKVFAGDDTTLIGTLPVILLTSGVPVFAGFEDAGGIGRVSLTQTINEWSPLIDDLEFSTVPEPSTLVMFMGLGAIGLVTAWRKRKRAA